MASAAFYRRGQHDIVGRVPRDCRGVTCVLDEIREGNDVGQPAPCFVRLSQVLTNLRQGASCFHFLDDCRRKYELERLGQKGDDDLCGWTARPDSRADKHVGIEQSADQGLLFPLALRRRLSPADLSASGTLRLERDFHRLFVRESIAVASLLPLEKLASVLARETTHLLEPFDRHESGEWLRARASRR
jgi:hypothetical protein